PLPEAVLYREVELGMRPAFAVFLPDGALRRSVGRVEGAPAPGTGVGQVFGPWRHRRAAALAIFDECGKAGGNALDMIRFGQPIIGRAGVAAHFDAPGERGEILAE